MDAELARRFRTARRAPLFDPAAVPAVKDGGALPARLLPHRGSMLLVDAVVAADPAAGRILGRRCVSASDPVFAGHFPGDPVYPGVLQVEAVGQCALCLAAWPVPGDAPGPGAPAAVRLVRILGAEFVAPVRPGDEVLLLAERLDDPFAFLALGQVLVEGRPACVCAFEALILDDEGSDG